jgi:hypothetical protein
MFKTVLFLFLVVLFNDFIGTLLAAIGALMVRVGDALTTIPNIW